jgi:hypothetical protein
VQPRGAISNANQYRFHPSLFALQESSLKLNNPFLPQNPRNLPISELL